MACAWRRTHIVLNLSDRTTSSPSHNANMLLSESNNKNKSKIAFLHWLYFELSTNFFTSQSNNAEEQGVLVLLYICCYEKKGNKRKRFVFCFTKLFHSHGVDGGHCLHLPCFCSVLLGLVSKGRQSTTNKYNFGFGEDLKQLCCYSFFLQLSMKCLWSCISWFSRQFPRDRVFSITPENKTFRHVVNLQVGRGWYLHLAFKFFFL